MSTKKMIEDVGLHRGARIVIAGVGSPPENGPAKKGIKM